MATGLGTAAGSARTGRRALFFATLIAAGIALLNMATGGALSAVARDIVAPLSAAGGRLGSAVMSNAYFSSRQSLEAKITALQSQVQEEQLQAAAFEALQTQNQSLSSLTHLAQTSPGLAAQVTSSVVSSPYGTFTVGAGSAEGITSGSLVLTSDGFVVGTIAQAQAHESLVNEIFAPGAQTPVTVDDTASVASGQGGQARAQVPHGTEVSIGDPVFAPEYGGKPIGTVAYVDSNPADAQQAVYISLPVSLASLQYVYVTP